MPDPVVRAIEENAEEFLMAMGRASGGEIRADEVVRWTIGGSPIDYHNAVARAELPPGQADDVIRQSVQAFEKHGVPGTWHVGPSMRPADIGERLLAHGFRADDEEAGMALDLDRATLAEPSGDVTVERVVDAGGLDPYAAVLERGFGQGPPEAAWVRSTFQTIGLGDDSAWRHYVATVGGEPVGTASLFLHGRVGGVYFVCAVPEARRRGVGAEVTLAALRDARSLGCRLAVLGSSRMGYSVYRRLGFEERCRVRIFAWDQT